MGDVTPQEAAKARRWAPSVLRLTMEAVSPEAKALVSHCLDHVVIPAQPAERQLRPSSVERMGRALGALLAGVISAPEDHYANGWLRRPLGTDSFSFEPVGRDQFRRVLDAMQAAGLVEVLAGRNGHDSRVRLSQAGRKLAADYGMTTGNVALHFAAQDVEGDQSQD